MKTLSWGKDRGLEPGRKETIVPVAVSRASLRSTQGYSAFRYPGVPKSSQGLETGTKARPVAAPPTPPPRPRPLPECHAPETRCPRVPRGPAGQPTWKEVRAVSGVGPRRGGTYATRAGVKVEGRGQGPAAEKQHQDTADAGGGCLRGVHCWPTTR